MIEPRTAAPTAGAAGLLAIAGLHVVWATGSSWPLRDRAALADAVVGRGAVPPPSACLAVAGALTAAAALVSGRPRRRPALARTGARTVVAVLTARGAAGLAGRTDALSPGSVSPRFRRLDRRVYAPLCLTLAALSAPAALRRAG